MCTMLAVCGSYVCSVGRASSVYVPRGFTVYTIFLGIFALPDEDFLKGCFIAFFFTWSACLACMFIIMIT